MRYKQGESRDKLSLGLLEELVAKDHYIRLLDAFIEGVVSSSESSYSQKGLSTTGQRPYGARTMLKLYLYGYLNRVTSSRRLEAEASRNIELIWLLENLQPDFKTIADYRRDNGEAIRSLLKAFNQFLVSHKYIDGKQVSVDSVRLKANTNRNAQSLKKIEGRLKHIDKQMTQYLNALNLNDEGELKLEQLCELDRTKKQAMAKIAELNKEIEDLQKKKKTLNEDTRRTRISFTDEEAVLSRSRDGVLPQYNTQMVVDDKHKLIMYSEATCDGNDRQQLKAMVEAIESEYDQRPQVARADADYFNIVDIKELEEQGTECYCNVPQNAKGAQGKDEQGLPIEFTYDEQQDEYTCSKGGRLIRKGYDPKKGGRGATLYQGVDCTKCPAKAFCTSSKKGRMLYRFDDEQWKQDYIRRMESPIGKQQSRKRRTHAEHPFGTIKMVFMDRQQLKMRGRYKVQTEICLYHFAYNFKRLQNISSFEYLKQQIRNWSLK
jgi:transposase